MAKNPQFSWGKSIIFFGKSKLLILNSYFSKRLGSVSSSSRSAAWNTPATAPPRAGEAAEAAEESQNSRCKPSIGEFIGTKLN